MLNSTLTCKLASPLFVFALGFGCIGFQFLCACECRPCLNNRISSGLEVIKLLMFVCVTCLLKFVNWSFDFVVHCAVLNSETGG